MSLNSDYADSKRHEEEGDTILDGSDLAPFHSFSPIRSDIALLLIEGLESASDGDDGLLEALLSSDEGLSEIFRTEGCDWSNGRENCKQSDSNLLLVGLTLLDSDDRRITPFDDGQARERLGRFPWEDGNPLSYLKAWSGTPEESNTDVMLLFEELDENLGDLARGHDRFENAAFGKLHGYLDSKQVDELERAFSKGDFIVRADEPLDGGVNEIVRQLTRVLRHASKHGGGILHFSH